MPTILNAERLSLQQVADELDVHVATVWRWTLYGVRGRKLPSFLIGGRRFVRMRDLEAFLAPEGGDERGSPDRAREAELAGKQLDSHGITPR